MAQTVIFVYRGSNREITQCRRAPRTFDPLIKSSREFVFSHVFLWCSVHLSVREWKADHTKTLLTTRNHQSGCGQNSGQPWRRPLARASPSGVHFSRIRRGSRRVRGVNPLDENEQPHFLKIGTSAAHRAIKPIAPPRKVPKTPAP